MESPNRCVRNLALHPVLFLREISNNFRSFLRDLVVPVLGMGEGLSVVAGQVQFRRAVVGLCFVFYFLRLAVSAEDVVAQVLLLCVFLQLGSETLHAEHRVVSAVLPRLQIIWSQLPRPGPVYCPELPLSPPFLFPGEFSAVVFTGVAARRFTVVFFRAVSAARAGGPVTSLPLLVFLSLVPLGPGSASDESSSSSEDWLGSRALFLLDLSPSSSEDWLGSRALFFLDLSFLLLSFLPLSFLLLPFFFLSFLRL